MVLGVELGIVAAVVAIPCLPLLLLVVALPALRAACPPATGGASVAQGRAHRR